MPLSRHLLTPILAISLFLFLSFLLLPFHYFTFIAIYFLSPLILISFHFHFISTFSLYAVFAIIAAVLCHWCHYCRRGFRADSRFILFERCTYFFSPLLRHITPFSRMPLIDDYDFRYYFRWLMPPPIIGLHFRLHFGFLRFDADYAAAAACFRHWLRRWDAAIAIAFAPWHALTFAATLPPARFRRRWCFRHFLYAIITAIRHYAEPFSPAAHYFAITAD